MPTRPKIFRPPHAKTSAQRNRDYDRRRGNSAARLYDRRWRKASKAYLAAHPFCVACAKRGEVKLATEVDHIIPHRGDLRLFWDPDNWQGLCKPDHSAKSRREEAERVGGGLISTS